MRWTVAVGVFGIVVLGAGSGGAKPLRCGGETLGAPCLTGLPGQCAYGRVICSLDGAAACAPQRAIEHCDRGVTGCSGRGEEGCAAQRAEPEGRARERRSPERRSKRRPQPPARAGVPG